MEVGGEGRRWEGRKWSCKGVGGGERGGVEVRGEVWRCKRGVGYR